MDAETSDPAPEPGGPAQHDETLVQVLATKILLDWLRNRQQLLIPLTLDLRTLPEEEATRLVHAMVMAALAEGTPESLRLARVETALEHLRADPSHFATLAAARERRPSLFDLLAEVPDVQAGTRFYAASLLAIDTRQPTNRHYLRYLSGRLQLPKTLTRNLEQLFRAPS